MRDVLEHFVLRSTTEPTVDAVLEVADRLLDRPVVLTDHRGNVLRSSRPVRSGRVHREVPSVADLAGLPIRRGSSVCATSISRPGSLVVWVDDATPDDHTVLTVAMLLAEYATLLDRAAVRWIPDIWLQRSRLVQSMIESAPADHVRRLARSVDHDLDRIHHVVVLEPLVPIDARRFAIAIGRRIRDFGLLAPVEERVVVVVGDPVMLHPLVAALRASTDLGAFQVGVSSASGDGHDLSRAYHQALSICDDGTGDDGITVSWFDELDPVAVMVRLSDAETTRRLIGIALGPLLDYGGAHRDEFLATLRLWLDSTGSLEEMAERLNVHRSTLVYRQRRIRELLGHDLRDPDRRFEIAVALRLLDRLPDHSRSFTDS